MHFSAARHWLNDPNGLVHHDGVYHLFFQFNPVADCWGNMSWGHATSPDLVHWTEQPLAMSYDDAQSVFSGCAVVDEQDTAGLGAGSMVAVYTSSPGPGAAHTHQSQCLATSTDAGQTWTPYAGNPVLDIGSTGFRDPKVFWWAPTASWRMVVALADEGAAQVYASPDLRHWTYLSDVRDPARQSGPWECPDLFPLPVDGDPDRIGWVLVVSVLTGGMTGGSGTQYFVGEFDGTTFTPGGPPRWLDHGPDDYAGVTYTDLPNGRRVLIGWMSNWQYAEAVPTAPWRGAMTLPRELGLATHDGDVCLTSRPVAELAGLRGEPRREPAAEVGAGTRVAFGASGDVLELEATLRAGTAHAFGLAVRVGAAGAETLIRYDVAAGELSLDRVAAGDTVVSPLFAGVYRAPLALENGRLRLHVVLDRCSVEVFAGDGRVVLTALVFPAAGCVGLAAFAVGGTAGLEAATVWPLRAIWPGTGP